MKRKPFIAVIGAGDAPAGICELAREVGAMLARASAVLVCGGLGGVMEAAARGAREAGGHTVGILPGYDQDKANSYIEFPVATGMGEARNAIVIGSADAIVALAGAGGTLAEIGFALKMGRPVVALRSWREIGGLHRAHSPAQAVEMALELARRERSHRADGHDA